MTTPGLSDCLCECSWVRGERGVRREKGEERSCVNRIAEIRREQSYTCAWRGVARAHLHEVYGPLHFMGQTAKTSPSPH